MMDTVKQPKQISLRLHYDNFVITRTSGACCVNVVSGIKRPLHCSMKYDALTCTSQTQY